MMSLTRLRNSRLDVSRKLNLRSRNPSTKARKVFRGQKSVNVFRIDQIVFEINLTNDKQNKIVNVLSNDHLKQRDEFCGKDKSISIRARAQTMAHIAEARNNFSLHRIYGSPPNRGKR